MNQDLIEKIKKIKLIATDVDGVLTEGFVFITGEAEEPFGKFNILDGFAVIMAREVGLKTAVISGRKSDATEARCRKLGMDQVFTGVNDKGLQIRQMADYFNIALDEIAYIGDDLIDLPAFKLVGFKCAPSNAINDVKQFVDYVSEYKGGTGAFRDIVELILRTQGKYQQLLDKYLQ